MTDRRDLLSTARAAEPSSVTVFEIGSLSGWAMSGEFDLPASCQHSVQAPRRLRLFHLGASRRCVEIPIRVSFSFAVCRPVEMVSARDLGMLSRYSVLGCALHGGRVPRDIRRRGRELFVTQTFEERAAGSCHRQL